MRFNLKHHKPFCEDQPNQGGKRETGLTLVEVVISVSIVALVFGAILDGYISTAKKVEWTGYSLAAQSLGLQAVEQARAATWDIAMGNNQLTNITLMSSSWNSSTLTYSGYTTNILDVPIKGTNMVVATNFVTIQQINISGSTNVQILLQIIRVDTVWPFTGWGNNSIHYYTNSLGTYFAPDNRDPSTLGVGG